MNKAQLFLKKHSSTILTVVGATGVVATSVLSVKATPKALALIEDAKKEKGENLTPIEVVSVAWKPYIPAVITGLSTIACIFGANFLNTRNQASLMSAYALLDRTFKEYKEKTKEIYGEEADINIKNAIVKSRYDESLEPQNGNVLFYDHNSMQFFESTMEKVMQAENEFLEIFHDRGYACLNEYYDILGLPRTTYGYQLGWFDIESCDPYNCHDLMFEYEETTIPAAITGDEDIQCWIITTNVPASYDYIL